MARQSLRSQSGVMPLIGDLADPIERSHFRQKLATTLGVDERTLQRFTPQPKRRKQASPPRSTQPPAAGADMPPEPDEMGFGDESRSVTFKRFVAPLATEQIEANFLRQALEYPEVMVRVDMLLRQGATANHQRRRLFE